MQAQQKITARHALAARNVNVDADLFILPFDFSNMTTGTPATKTQQVPQGAPFLHIKSTYFAVLHAAGNTPQSQTALVPNVTCTIQDNSTGRQISIGNVFVPGIFGTQAFPFVLPNPRVWPGNTSITIQATNNANDAIDLSLYFIGVRLFD